MAIDVTKILDTIRAGLVTEFLNSGAFAQADIAFENVKFDSVQGKPHCKLFMLPYDDDLRTMGDIGKNEHTGELQVTLMWPELTGTVKITQKADEIRSHFTQLKRIIYNDLTINIPVVKKAKGYPDGEWYAMPVSILYKVNAPRG